MTQKTDSMITKKDNSVREKIIITTLNIIAKGRGFAFTIRDVIKQAGVNIAAVNYYFGSKGKLLEEIHQYFLKKISELSETITQKKLTPQEKVFLWFDELIDYLVQNPGMIQIMRKNIDLELPITEKINDIYLNFILGNLTLIFPDSNQKENKHIALQLISAIAFPLFYPHKTLLNSFEIDFSNTPIRQSYIHSILSIFKIEK